MKHLNDFRSSHYYTKDGEPAYGADIRRARKESLLPSVTTVISIIEKPALNIWSVEQALIAAYLNPKIDDETQDAYVKRMYAISKKISSDACSFGSNVHKMIENYITNESSVISYSDKESQAFLSVQPWLFDNIHSGSCEKVLVNKEHGFAGRVDWHGVLKNGKYMVIDFKTQNVKPDKPFAFYPDWLYQLSAYAKTLDSIYGCMSVVVSSNPDDIRYDIKEYTKEEIDSAFDIFLSILKTWKKVKGAL